MANERILDIDLSATNRVKVRVDGDDNRIIMLDISDMTIANRLGNTYKELQSLMDKVSDAVKEQDISDATAEEKLLALTDKLTEIDAEMRSKIDYLFDANVSEVCAPTGSMYDVYNGMFRFEHIIDTLTKLYEDNINSEYKKMKARMSKHTSKYTAK